MFRKFKEAIGVSKSYDCADGDAPAKEDYVEAVACKVDDMKHGEMRIIEIGEGKALLVHDSGEYYAVGPKCTHYGAPLNTGAYCRGRVRCPWHGACFNVKTGDIEDFPGLDSIPKHEVHITNGEVVIRALKSSLENFRKTKPTTKRQKTDNRTFVVVGGGAAGASCVETLRQEGFSGRIVIVTQEPHRPIDRTRLSKSLDATSETLALRKADAYDDWDVEFMLSKQVSGLDANNKTVQFVSGDSLKYDKIMFATGGSARNLNLPGSDLKNVCVLRSIEDGNYIAGIAKDKNVVIIGTSFIGLEVAGFMLDKGGAATVTIVGRSEIPLKQVLGEKIGIVMKNLLESRGGKFVFLNPPKEFTGEGGSLTAVVLQDGTTLQADLCVIGAGVSPATSCLKNTGVTINPQGYIVVDKKMKTNVADVFAAGDITTFPLFMVADDHVNIQHWQMAIKQGRMAALNMLDKEEEIRSVPFFWTMILGKGIRYAGYGSGHDSVIVHGSLEEFKFIAYFIKGDTVIAVATMGSDPVAAQAGEMFYHQIPFTKQDVMDDTGRPPQGPAWTSKLLQ